MSNWFDRRQTSPRGGGGSAPTQGTSPAQHAEQQQQTGQNQTGQMQAEQPAAQSAAPKTVIQPLQGAVTTDGASFIADLATYDALLSKADEIALQFKDLIPEGGKVLLLDALDFFSEDVQAAQVLQQITTLEQAMRQQAQKNAEMAKQATEEPVSKDIGEEAKEEQPPTPLTGFAPILGEVTDVVKAAADLVGYFQVNYDIKSRPVNMDDLALRSRLAGRLLTRQPGQSPRLFYLPGLHRLKTSPVLDAYKNCLQAQLDLLASMARLKDLDQAKPEPPASKGGWIVGGVGGGGTPAEPPPAEQLQSSSKKEEKPAPPSTADLAYARSEALLLKFDEVNASINTIPSGCSYTPLVTAALRQYLTETDITHLLYVKVTASGGEAITSQRIFRSGVRDFMGGGVLTCILAQTDGQILAAASEVALTHLNYTLGKSNSNEMQVRRLKFK